MSQKSPVSPNHPGPATRGRRPLLALVAVLGGLALFAGACGGSDSGSSGGGDDNASSGDCPVDALDDVDEPVEIVMWHGIRGLAAQTLDEFATDYNASQDKVKLRVESQGDYNEQQTKFTASLRDPDTLPDLLVAEETNLRFVIDSQAAIPVDACIDADPEAAAVYDTLMDAARNYFTVEDTLWPGAFGVSTPVIYYNKAHFAEAGLDPEKPPTTLEEIRTASEAIKKARPDGIPFVFRADAWWLEHLDAAQGEALVNKDNGRSGVADESLLLNPATSEWTTWMSDMTDAELMKTIAYSATFDGYLAMASESSSMLIETSTAATTVDALITGSLNAEDVGLDAEADLSALAFPNLDAGVGQLPGFEGPGSGAIGGNAWFLIGAQKSPEKVAAAWDFLKWATQTENQVKWTTQGSYLPVFAAVEDSPEMEEFFTSSRPGEWLHTAFESLQNVDADFPGPVIGPYKEFRTALRAALESSLVGGEPIDQAFDEANTTFQGALEAYKAEVGG